jgi:hypothetical protein
MEMDREGTCDTVFLKTTELQGGVALPQTDMKMPRATRGSLCLGNTYTEGSLSGTDPDFSRNMRALA